MQDFNLFLCTGFEHAFLNWVFSTDFQRNRLNLNSDSYFDTCFSIGIPTLHWWKRRYVFLKRFHVSKFKLGFCTMGFNLLKYLTFAQEWRIIQQFPVFRSTLKITSLHHCTINIHFTARTPPGVMTSQSHSVYHAT